ncbi:hypothetical protein F5Y09DRAFT_350885 [Xylaria sp. FL1042]|nr:hypothetical protein F5Y09DRAFT_350885 [Xylaria sp. FL1042]
MFVQLRDLLSQSPGHFSLFYNLPGSSNPRSSQKSWAADYPEILPPELGIVFDPSIEAIQAVLGPEDELDRLLLSREVHPLNQTVEALQSEGDTGRAFYTHIAYPVQFAFERIMRLRSEVGPPGPTTYGETADFCWLQGNQCALVGELKRHGIIDPIRWLGRKPADANLRSLGRELRGYCHRYQSAAVAIFDGDHLILLIFQASNVDEVEERNCPVRGFIFPYTSARLRYCLFRVVSHQLRRCQAQMVPDLKAYGHTRSFEWWSGSPRWENDATGETIKDHPRNYLRRLNPANGEWYWDTPNGREIRFRTRFIRAPAYQIMNRYVYRLDVPSSPIGEWLLFCLPPPIRTWAKSFFPEWFLPPVVILKETNPERPNDFKNEVDIYKRLRHLQGFYIPHCFGTAISDDCSPALLLSYVEGTPLHQLELDALVAPQVLEAYRQRTYLRRIRDDDIMNKRLASALRDMYDALTQSGVVHGDAQLHNFIWVKDHVVAVDLEFSYLLPSDITNIHEFRSLISEIGRIIKVDTLEDPAEKAAWIRAHNEAVLKKIKGWNDQLPHTPSPNRFQELPPMPINV